MATRLKCAGDAGGTRGVQTPVQTRRDLAARAARAGQRDWRLSVLGSAGARRQSHHPAAGSSSTRPHSARSTLSRSNLGARAGRGGQGAAARGARRTCGNRRLWRLRRKEPDWIASYRAWRNGLDDVRTGSVTGVRESCPRRGLYAFGGGGCTLEPRSRLVPAEARRFHDLREMYGVFRGFGPRGCPSEHVLLGAA
jgi:hypothetical protein